MDTFNINILPEENSVNITQGEPVNISVSQEVVQIAKIDESVNLEFLGDVTKIDANYPEALAAAQTAIEKAAEIEQTVEQGTADFNANAAEKTTEFNQNAANQTTAFNANAVNKTVDFNANAVSQTTLFNENAAEKQAGVDASAALAKQYAIGEPTEPLGNSAKYWAEQASSELSGLTSRVSSIEGKIPSAASSSNQLADKSYVDTADNDLQSQIDAIVSSSDVFDVVGTYAELQAYDITTVPVNDIVKVLNDSSHGGAATYYRCIETAGAKSWSYIGSEGASYTKGEADAKFSTILATGSSLDYANDILILKNASGTALSSVTIQASAAADGKSITKNTSDELQTVGVINQNDTTTALKVWSGDEAALPAVKDANTFYATEEMGVKLLDVLYPVGSIYITTNAACPLSTLIAGSTWVLVGQDRVLQGAGTRGVVGTTLNESLPNITSSFGIRAGVDAPDGRANYIFSRGSNTSAVQTTTGQSQSVIFTTKASLSSSTYQDNAPVQPDAYLVNIYRRIS